MSFGNYLRAGAVELEGDCANRKRALEAVAALLGAGGAAPAAAEIFKSLLAREKLGSTGLGHGIAVPHCRMPGVATPRAAVLRARRPVDFDAPDGAPVRLFCALVVGADATDEHLQIFADLVGQLNDAEQRDALLRARDRDAVLALLTR